MNQDSPTKRTQVMRLPKRGDYSAATIHSILDAGLRGQPPCQFVHCAPSSDRLIRRIRARDLS